VSTDEARTFAAGFAVLRNTISGAKNKNDLRSGFAPVRRSVNNRPMSVGSYGQENFANDLEKPIEPKPDKKRGRGKA
jgi:hypothetical protein